MIFGELGKVLYGSLLERYISKLKLIHINVCNGLIVDFFSSTMAAVSSVWLGLLQQVSSLLQNNLDMPPVCAHTY